MNPHIGILGLGIMRSAIEALIGASYRVFAYELCIRDRGNV
jgi:hypothetical protein